MSIDASDNTLMLQAGATIDVYLEAAISSIDGRFVPGYAK